MQRYARVSFYLDEVNREPLTEPKQDRPTNTGMIHAITPRCLLPKSWGEGEQRAQGSGLHEQSGKKGLQSHNDYVYVHS